MAIIKSIHKIKVFQSALQISLFTAVKYSRLLKKPQTNKQPKKNASQNPKENPLVDEAILNVAQRQGQCLSLSLK